VVADYEGAGIRRSRIVSALKPSDIPIIMGILNITPDSFHPASRHGDVEKGLAMWNAGATWVDVGGESTRPNAEPVPVEKEIQRTIPIIQGLRDANPDGLISIDTRRVEVANAALNAGADMVNDVSGLRNPEMFELIVERGCAVCIMHMQGEPGNMQENPQYENPFAEVSKNLEKVADRLVERGHDSDLIVLDPGIGFGKTLTHNLELLKSPISKRYSTLWGISRKSLIGTITDTPETADRLSGTIASSIHAMDLGIQILRVHDVEENLSALRMYNELR